MISFTEIEILLICLQINHWFSTQTVLTIDCVEISIRYIIVDKLYHPLYETVHVIMELLKEERW